MTQLRGKGRKKTLFPFMSFQTCLGDCSFVNIIKYTRKKRRNWIRRETRQELWSYSAVNKIHIIIFLPFCLLVYVNGDRILYFSIVKLFFPPLCKTLSTKNFTRAHPLIIFWPHQPHECAIKMHIEWEKEDG